MVGDMSRVTLNSLTYQKFLLCVSSQGQDLYSHQKLNMYITGSHLRAVTDADNDDNAGSHITTISTTLQVTRLSWLVICIIKKNNIAN